jgi:undecaprenyl pyrophosphate phosphatase UppP
VSLCVFRAPSVIIGIPQAIAMLPGISRSGAAISTSVLLELIEQELLVFLS